MVRRKKAKVASLVLSAAILAISTVQLAVPISLQHVGICKGSALMPRLVYHFFHANIFHAALNAWCLLALAFIYHISVAELIIAYIIASSYPIDTLSSVCGGYIATNPTIGLSGICFALMGQVLWHVKRKMYYCSCVCAIILIGFILPNINATLHLYCYTIGIVVGFFNSPAPWQKR